MQASMGDKKKDRLSHCEILGVTDRATRAEIKYAFIRASEAYQYLIENELGNDTEPAFLDPNPPLLNYVPFEGVNLKSQSKRKRRLLPLAAAIAILVALIPQYREAGNPAVTNNDSVKIRELSKMAENFYQNKRYSDCIYEISLLRNYDRTAANNSDGLYDRCVKGTIDEALNIREGSRAPASLGPQSIDFDPTRMKDEDFVRAACSGQLFRRFERIYASPELPVVKVISAPAYSGLNPGIAALSRQLRQQFHQATEPAGRIARDLQIFCAAHPEKAL